MTALAYDNLRDLKLWRIHLPNPFVFAMGTCCVLMYMIYCRGVGIPEWILSVPFLFAIPFFEEKEYLALGTCLPLISGIPKFRIFLIFCFPIFFIKYHKRFVMSPIFLIVGTFILIEGLHGFCNDYFLLWEFLSWAGNFSFFALCVSLLDRVNVADLLKLMKYYISCYCVVSLIVLQRFISESGSVFSFLSDGKRLGDIREVSNYDFAIGESYGLLFNENELGLLSVLCLGLCLILIHYRYLNRYVGLFVTIYSTIIGFMTGSRTFIVLLFVVVFFVFFKSLKQFFFNGSFYLVLTLVFLVCLYEYSDFINLVFNNLINRFLVDDITSGRIDLWYFWNDLYLSTPSAWMTGIGSIGIKDYIRMSEGQNVIHGAIQQAYVYWGIVGLFLMLYMQIIIYRSCKKINGGSMCKSNYLLMVLFYLSIAQGQYLTGLFYPQLLAAIVMAYPFWKHRNEL